MLFPVLVWSAVLLFMAAAYVSDGYEMQETADFLGVHYATVSRAIHREETGSA
jgi:DNA-binding MarR family transcriptional regulator